MTTSIPYIVSVIFFLSGFAAISQNEKVDIINGRILFQTHCGACHGIHAEVLGPQLSSVTKKRTTEWLRRFITNSQAVIAGDDPYAIDLFKRYHHQVMPSFRQLKIADITNILKYIEAESTKSSDDVGVGIQVDEGGGPSVFHGQLIFQQQCASCHFIDHEGSYAPALGSVTKRHSQEWLHRFIRNSQKVIKSGDEYAIQLFNRFDHHEMVPMEFLTDDEIKDVLGYIEYRSSSDPPTAGASGKKSQFGKTYSEFRSTTIDKPIQGKTFLRDVIVILLITGFSIYAIIITRLFKYLR